MAQTEHNTNAWSVFSKQKKILIIAFAAFGGFFSPVSAAIYFPAIQTIANDFDKSTSLINLTITTYMIFQGLAPTVFGDLAEMWGKRPVYLIAFTIYIASNIGLALQNSYAALLVLRCLQSTGSSAAIALAISSAGDVARGSERGKYVGITSSLFLIGPAIGPVIGGLLSGYLSWRAIFWFLAILSAVFLMSYALFCPETARSVVGNGSIKPPKLNQSFFELLSGRHSRSDSPDVEKDPASDQQSFPKRSWRIPNPGHSLILMKEKDIAMILFYNSLMFAATYQLTASVVTIFKDKYGYNDIQIGLCYLPYGLGTMISSYIGGRLLDWNLRRIAAPLNYNVDNRAEAADSQAFPWEKARLQVIAPAALAASALFLCYGWILQAQTSVAVPLVFQFFIGLTATSSTNAFSVMLVDSYPTKSATASAANNFTRCLLGAGATAAIQPMLTAMGRGGCFSFVAGVLFLFSPSMLALAKHGPKWRKERHLRG